MTGVVHVRIGGTDMTLSSADGTDLVASKLADGDFERPLPEILLALLRSFPGPFIDVGANSGAYSVMACRSDRRATAIAFEPMQAPYEVLQENIVLNGLQERVAVHQLALSNTPGVLPLYLPATNHGHLDSSGTLSPTFHKGSRGSETVRVATLDSFALPAISVIKIDVETFEPQVIEGAHDTIRRTRPIIITEALAIANFQRLNAALPNCDYAVYRVRESGLIREDRIQWDVDGWNHIAVPREKDFRFRRCMAGAGIPIVDEREPIVPRIREKLQAALHHPIRAARSLARSLRS